MAAELAAVEDELVLLLTLTLATALGAELAGIALAALLTTGCTGAAATLTPPAGGAVAGATVVVCCEAAGKGVARPDCDSRNG